MRVVAISGGPLSAERLEKAGCHLVSRASAAGTFFAVLTYLDRDHGLTPRQREVLRLTASGLTAAEVAHKLQLSRKTVERHLRHCRERLSVTNDVQLGVVTERLGL
jgi:DNA-binding CsgD family transcriptional regulator